MTRCGAPGGRRVPPDIEKADRMQPLRTIAIGGSNTVMKPGWLTALPGALAAHGIAMDLQANLAVGNTTIQMGLMKLLESPDLLAGADLLIIEYTLNDTTVFARSVATFEAWTRSFEGAIRIARQANPDIIVLPVILAARAGQHRASINVLHGGVHYLAHHYALPLADVNTALVQRFGRDVHDMPGVYGDAAHYQRPVLTTLCAEIVAERLAAWLAARNPRSPLPDPVDPQNHQAASVLRPQPAAPSQVMSFRNHLYSEQAVDLGRATLHLEIEGGALLAARYVCTPDIARCYLGIDDDWFELSTLQPGMVQPKYRFLVSMLTAPVQPPKAGVRRYALTGMRPEATPAILRQTGTRMPVRPEVTLPICAVLHTGRLISAEVREAAPLTAPDRVAAPEPTAVAP